MKRPRKEGAIYCSCAKIPQTPVPWAFIITPPLWLIIVSIKLQSQEAPLNTNSFIPGQFGRKPVVKGQTLIH